MRPTKTVSGPDAWLRSPSRRVPVLRDTGLKLIFNGPESFTPDDRYHLGEVPELGNYFVAAGFNSIDSLWWLP